MRFQLTEDLQHRAAVLTALRDNEGYCPCAIAKTPDTKCICRDFRQQKEGPCHCGLYVKIKEEGDK